MKKLAELFEQTFKIRPDSVDALPSSSGSNRRYFRMIAGKIAAIGVAGCNATENRTFIKLSEHFRGAGLPVPEVYAWSDDCLCYLQEDLGDTTLFDAVSQGRKSGNYSEKEKFLIKKAVSMLPAIQFRGGAGLDFNICRPIREFDAMSVRFDLNYFKYCFLKPAGIEFDEVRLEKDFEAMCRRLAVGCRNTFMYRDFQSRNIMVLDDRLYFIDFQGGRKGPIYYDAASFILQAKADYSKKFREELLETYLEALSEFADADKKQFLAEYRQFALFRTLQVLGAYGFRGNYEGKAHFVESIPFAVANLKSLLETPFAEYPYLSGILLKIIGKYTFTGKKDNDGKLRVRIFSFSYKNGMPRDESGNGGGYVFDCRGVPNPGRIEKYRSFTGLDREVREYMEQFPETEAFFKRVFSLAEAHIDNYIGRGFTDLMFSFGCTGGQHRSVYFAQRLAERLAEKYDIRIIVNHRERGIVKEFGK